MAGQQVGYIRVSSVLQNTDRQLDGVELDERFVDKVSAKDANRPQLQACLRHLRKGDTLHVHSIDRLARNLKDLEQIVDQLTGEGVTVRFHKEGLVFSGGENPMQRLMLQMMGAFAEFERSLINERRREGMAVARAKGRKIGRPPKLSAQQSRLAVAAVNSGESKAQVARRFGISRQKLYTLLKETVTR